MFLSETKETSDKKQPKSIVIFAATSAFTFYRKDYVMDIINTLHT